MLMRLGCERLCQWETLCLIVSFLEIEMPAIMYYTGLAHMPI